LFGCGLFKPYLVVLVLLSLSPGLRLAVVTVTLSSSFLSSPHVSLTAFSVNSLQFLISFAGVLHFSSHSFQFVLTYACLFAGSIKRGRLRPVDHRTFVCRLLRLSPGVSLFLCFFFCSSLPRVPWPNSSPLLGVGPCNGLTYPKRVSCLTLFYLV